MKNENETEGGGGFPTPPWERPPGTRFNERGSRPRLRFAVSCPDLGAITEKRYPQALGITVKEGGPSKSKYTSMDTTDRPGKKYTSTDTLNLLDTPNEISSRSGLLGTINPQDHPPQFPDLPYKKLSPDVHLEDARDKRLHEHPSRLRKLIVGAMEKIHLYKGEIRWYIKDALEGRKGGPNYRAYIRQAIQETKTIVHSLKFREVTDINEANLIVCLSKRGNDKEAAGYVEYDIGAKGLIATITLCTSPSKVLSGDYSIKQKDFMCVSRDSGPFFYARYQEGGMYGIFKTKFDSIGYFDNHPLRAPEYNTNLNLVLHHEIAHCFGSDHAYTHTSSGEWAQTFYEHRTPPTPGRVGKKREHPMLSFNSDGSVKPHEHGYLAKDSAKPLVTVMEDSKDKMLARCFISKQRGGMEPKTPESKVPLTPADVKYGTLDIAIMGSLNDHSHRPPPPPPLPPKPIPKSPASYTERDK